MDIMVDIETLGTKPDAIITQIACINNDKDLCMNINVLSQLGNRSFDQGTIDWWSQQDLKPKLDGSLSLLEGLSKLAKFIGLHDTIWCVGPQFDITILENAYKQYELPIPWKYSSIRDLRTIREWYGLKLENNHDALDDCHSQLKLLKEAYILRGESSA